MADYYNTDVKIFWLYDQARNIYGSRRALPINDGSRHKTQRIPYLFFFFFCLRYSLYNATPQYTVSHFTVIVHIAKFWQLIGAVPWYGSDLGYSYSLWLLGDVPVIHGVVLLPALQAFLLQDSFLQPLHLNGRLKKKKERKKERKKEKKVLPAGQRREVLRSTTFKPLPPHLKAPF